MKTIIIITLIYNTMTSKEENIHSRLFLRRGSSSTRFSKYSLDANGKRTCSINLGKISFLQHEL